MSTFKQFRLPDQRIVQVETIDNAKEFKWRMCIDGRISNWSNYYAGVLVFEGIGYASAYWEGCLPVEIPFQITPTTPIT